MRSTYLAKACMAVDEYAFFEPIEDCFDGFPNVAEEQDQSDYDDDDDDIVVSDRMWCSIYLDEIVSKPASFPVLFHFIVDNFTCTVDIVFIMLVQS